MIKVFCPSYKRPGNVKVAGWIPEAVICVHEFEAAEYRKHHSNDLLILPDSLRGNMARVRNFILDNCDSEICVMMDDDVDFVSNLIAIVDVEYISIVKLQVLRCQVVQLTLIRFE